MLQLLIGWNGEAGLWMAENLTGKSFKVEPQPSFWRCKTS